MVLGGVTPVGSSRIERLDPLALPVRFTASDAGADERSRDVELTRERVVLRRAVRGIRMAVNLPVSSFLGPVSGLSTDAPARLALYELLGEPACAAFGPEDSLEWVLPAESGALVGFWSFRKFTVRRIRGTGETESEVTLPRGGVGMRKPVAHPLAGYIGLLSDGSVVSIEDAQGTSTSILPAVRG